MLTVAICTHNRAKDSEECLAALRVQGSDNDLAILLVDSASDGNQAALLSQAAGAYAAEYLRLDQPGLSLARNAAANRTAGEWIAYLDDDVVPAPDWLRRIRAAIDRAEAATGILGGKIVPQWPEGADVSAVTRRWKLLLSCTEKDGSGKVADGYNICGANFAIRRSALALANGFPTELGRVKGKLLSGEEAYLIDFLAQRGVSSMYDSSFEVRHKIGAGRLTRSWVKQRAYWEGVSRVKIDRLLGMPAPGVVGIAKLGGSAAVLGALSLFSSDVDLSIRRARAIGGLRALLDR